MPATYHSGVDQVAPTSRPDDADGPTSAEPSVLARVLAFTSIIVAGAAGGFIGWAFVDLQCTDDCTLLAGIVGLVTAIAAAIGVGIVAVLALRALGEWQVQQGRGAPAKREPGLVIRRGEDDDPGTSGRARVC